jgi:hypothetical protein
MNPPSPPLRRPPIYDGLRIPQTAGTGIPETGGGARAAGGEPPQEHPNKIIINFEKSSQKYAGKSLDPGDYFTGTNFVP